MTTTRSIVAGLAILVGLAPGTAAAAPFNAFSFNEVGDAGDLPATSQAAGVLSFGPFGVGPAAATITGSIGFPADVDMFAFTVTRSGDLAATTVGQSGTLIDTQLFLFSFPGLGVAANDDSQKTLRSTFGAVPVSPGLYFLAISSFDRDPVSPGGLIFPSVPFDGNFINHFGFPLLGPGAGSAITGWQGSGGTGTYSILLGLSDDFSANPVAPALVPEPTTLLLFGTTMAGLGLAARWGKRKQN